MTKNFDLYEINKLVDKTPIILEGDPIELIELEDIVIEKNIRDYVLRVDGLTPLRNERTIILGPITNYFDRWPVIQADKKCPSDVNNFNALLYKNYEQAQKVMFTQSEIASEIEENIDVDVIVLLLIDGLSYSDWLEYPDVRSCLVDGPTITPIGFRNIIGDPPIAHRLFNKGFRRRLGFSYWDRNNQLTNLLFYGFDPSSQMKKVSEFKDVLIALEKLSQEQTYVQILVNGLDSICHRHRGRPPVKAIAREIYENVYINIVEKLRKIGVAGMVYATADHGILWKPDPDDDVDFLVIKDDRVSSHRYTTDPCTCF